jgi:hypothetical protein
MGEQTKIRPESIVIMGNPSFIAGTYNEYIKAEVDKTNSQPEKSSYPFIISAQTSDGKAFEAKGNTSENEAKTAQITNYKVGDKEYRLLKPVEVKIEDGKLSKGIEIFEQLINKGSATTGRFGSRETIKSEHVSTKTADLSTDKAMQAAKAQVDQHNEGFKSAFNNLPAKSTGKETSLG